MLHFFYAPPCPVISLRLHKVPMKCICDSVIVLSTF